MSIAILGQVYDEVRRLAIAGGAVASGDFRLKKLVPTLEQAGAKAPVFARVGQAAQAVVESDEKTASAALLELATLVNAILYTQGETGIAGEWKPLATTDLGAASTQASARLLKPLLEALKSTGSGRLEIVRDAIERGAFKDLRLVKPALSALDDPYPELADVIAEKVLPMYGRAIVPELRTRLDIKGRGGGNLHRLRLLHKLDPEGSRELVRQALDEGSKEMRVVAIECLGTTGSDLAYLLEQAKAKAREVRAAALRALSGAGTSAAEVIGALKKAIDSEDLALIVDRVRGSKVREIHEYALAQAERQLAETLATKDAKLQGPAITRLQQLVLSLEGRADAPAEAFLLRCFEAAPKLAAIKSTPSGQDFNELLAHVMARGTPTMRQKLIAAHRALTAGMLHPAYHAARATLTPVEFYDQFSPLLAAFSAKRGKKSADSERAEALASVLMGRIGMYFHRPWTADADAGGNNEEAAPRELDPRWLDAAIDAQAVDLVCHLARPGHTKLNQYLQEQVGDGRDVLETMVRIGHPGAADAIIDQLKKQAKATHYGYYGYWYGRLIPDLPKSVLPKFEALLPTLPEKLVDQLMEPVMALKEKPE